MATLAFSYAHADEQLRNELEVHLAPLRREGLIDPWHDRRILAGQEFKGEIDLHFEAADIILLGLHGIEWVILGHFRARGACK